MTRTTLILSALGLILSGCNRPLSSDESPAPASDARSYTDPTVATWAEIKDFGYDQRMNFSSGIERMVKTKEAEFESLRVKQRNLSIKPSPERKVAEQHFEDLRIQLRLQLARLRASPADTWLEQKAISVATWVKLHEAFAVLQENRFG